MLPAEADLMGRWVADLGLASGSVCLNVGSSTRRFREVTQPHIADRLLRPMEQRAIRIVHCDLKAADGVDEVGDLLDPAVQARLRPTGPDLIICSNLLEHLSDPRAFAAACGALVRPGGYGLFTLPLSYPYHPDPIDTMLRLRPAEVAAMLPGWRVVAERELEAGNHWTELRDAGRPISTLAKQVARAALPIYKPSEWWPAAHKLLWLFKPFRVTLVMLQKPAAS